MNSAILSPGGRVFPDVPGVRHRFITTPAGVRLHVPTAADQSLASYQSAITDRITFCHDAALRVEAQAGQSHQRHPDAQSLNRRAKRARISGDLCASLRRRPGRAVPNRSICAL